MSLKYDLIGELEQAQVLKATLQAIEQEHYANTLQLERAKAVGDDPAPIEQALERLELQHAALKKK